MQLIFSLCSAVNLAYSFWFKGNYLRTLQALVGLLPIIYTLVFQNIATTHVNIKYNKWGVLDIMI
jgi:hypothetical protein